MKITIRIYTFSNYRSDSRIDKERFCFTIVTDNLFDISGLVRITILKINPQRDRKFVREYCIISGCIWNFADLRSNPRNNNNNNNNV